MIKIEELLDAGVHFGHRVTKWNPRMAPFIFGERNKIHIIDLIQTLHYLNETSNFLKNFKNQVGLTDAREGRVGEQTILFVGTKKQAASSIERAAHRVPGSHYVNHRWLGGLLTNWTTMKICIDLLNSLEKDPSRAFLRSSAAMEAQPKPTLPGEQMNEVTDASVAHFSSHGISRQGTESSESRHTVPSLLPKKEQAMLKKQYQKLNTFFGGIKHMKGLPNLVVIVGQDSEMNAVRECQKLQNSLSESLVMTGSAMSRYAKPSGPTSIAAKSSIGKVMPRLPNTGSSVRHSNDELVTPTMPILRTITILDTKCDPQLTDLFSPANDDSTKSIDLILNHLTDALV